MRPTRLEIQGFSSFRDPVELDFGDAELFVLSGPTGSGKSSVIDAMTFALYGAVPRYGQKAVTAVVSKGKNEARVCLEFTAGGKSYTAVRAARMLGDGRATTKEARLECDGKVLADNADDVSDAAEDILGLPFKHFTRCVVLPQGEFQEFLHAGVADRQDMLIRLLGLDLYEKIAKAAYARAEAAKREGDLLERRLEEDFGDVSKERIKEAKTRLEELTELAQTFEESRSALEALRGATSMAGEQTRKLSDQLKSIKAIKTPKGAETLAGRIEKLEVSKADRSDLYETAKAERKAAEAKRETLPERAEVAGQLRDHSDLKDVQDDILKGKKALEEAKKAVTAGRKNEATLQALRDKAQAALDQVRQSHTAFHLAESLEVGKPCPVCLAEVGAIPEHDVPEDFEAAADVLQRTGKDLDSARIEANEIQQAAIGLEATLKGHKVRDAELEKRLRKAPPATDLSKLLEAIQKADQGVTTATKSERQAEEQLGSVTKDLEAHGQELGKAWSVWEDARGQVTRLGPPARVENDLLGSWRALAEWASGIVDDLRKKLKAAEGAEKTAEDQERELRSTLVAQAKDGGLIVKRDQDPLAAVQGAQALQGQLLTDLKKRAKQAKKIEAELTDWGKKERTARELHRLLGAQQFERWLLGRALRTLVRGASSTLQELSSGAYSLKVDSKNQFEVIDHLNAGETRMAKSLSGGETFLTSLALALSLSEQVAELGAKGASRLESLFLDEGFGTLDPETLDQVATTIEELGAKGRMVGIITHVRELAERIPVRFELSKQGNVSTVTKTVA